MKLNKAMLDAVYNLLLARRNGNMRREQIEYNRLRAKCETAGYDMGEVMDTGRAWLVNNSAAAGQNGLI